MDLQSRGLRVGGWISLQPGCYIDAELPHLIEIGAGSSLSMYARLLAHVPSTGSPGGVDVGPVVVGERVFIGAGATVLPGATIGDYAVIGAGSVVRGTVPAGAVVAGDPARRITESGTLRRRHEVRQRTHPDEYIR